MTTCFDRARRYREILKKIIFYSSVCTFLATLFSMTVNIQTMSDGGIGLHIVILTLSVVSVGAACPDQNTEWKDNQ